MSLPDGFLGNPFTVHIKYSQRFLKYFVSIFAFAWWKLALRVHFYYNESEGQSDVTPDRSIENPIERLHWAATKIKEKKIRFNFHSSIKEL